MACKYGAMLWLRRKRKPKMFVYEKSFTALLFLCLLSSLSLTIESQPTKPYLSHYCPNTTTFPSNSTYQANLNSLLSSLASNATGGNLFYSTSSGGSSDVIYGQYLCRGDVSNTTCEECVSAAIDDVRQRCPVEKDAVIWYDNCLVRYSNQSMFSIPTINPPMYMWDTAGNASDRFNQILGNTLDEAVNQALKATSGLKNFGTREETISELQKLYSLVQCTPDLSSLDCDACLQNAMATLDRCCSGRRGARVVAPSCVIRYEVYPFYNETPGAAADPGNDNNGTTRTIIIVVASVVGNVTITIFIICMIKGARKSTRQTVETDDDDTIKAESLQMDFATVVVATKNFSDENKLGQGGFGAVYKGLLPNGQEIAVKRLSMDSRQGDLEFKNEVLLVAKLQHRNLVRLLGFCLGGQERLLVYEFVPNASLDHFIFDRAKRALLNWDMRYKIIGGIARGLLYLHEDSRLRIIHRDLKASNVLLDDEMSPKISDFGTARLFGQDETQGNTSRVVGTFGYMAPEYVLHGQFSVKSDVFSFGILILEIVSGQKNGQSQEGFVNCAWKNWREGTVLDLIDPTLSDDGSKSEMMKCIHIGLLCVQNVADRRPTMATVVLMLNSHSISLPVPMQPANFMDSNTESDVSSSSGYSSMMSEWKPYESEKVLPLSQNEASITTLTPR